MKTPAIIFTVFIVAAGAIIALNKNTSAPTPKPTIVVDDITAGSANQPITTVSFKDSILHKGKIKEGDLVCLAAFGSGFTWASAIIKW